MIAHKLAPAVKTRLSTLKTEYRRARCWHYAASREMDVLWADGLAELANAATPAQKDAAVNRLAADLDPYLAGVPASAPPAPARRKTGQRVRSTK